MKIFLHLLLKEETTSSRLFFWNKPKQPFYRPEEFILSNLWKAIFSKRCKFFLWTVMHRRLDTFDWHQHKYKGTVLNPQSMPYTETLDHIFIHCSLAGSIWNIFHLVFGKYTSMPFQVEKFCEGTLAHKVHTPKQMS